MRDLPQIASLCRLSSVVVVKGVLPNFSQARRRGRSVDSLPRDGNFRRNRPSRIIHFFKSNFTRSLVLSLSLAPDRTRVQLPPRMNSPFGSPGLRSFVPDINDAEDIFARVARSLYFLLSLFSASFTGRREPHTIS